MAAITMAAIIMAATTMAVSITAVAIITRINRRTTIGEATAYPNRQLPDRAAREFGFRRGFQQNAVGGAATIIRTTSKLLF
jgi:hypothetical protein